MTIKSIQIEYEDGMQIALDSEAFARALVAFLESLHGEKAIEVTSMTWTRCPICQGTGRAAGGTIGAEGFCNCAVGKDLRRVESKDFENTVGGTEA